MIPWSTFHNHRAVATSIRCIEISRRAALGIIVHVRSFKRNSRARGRSCVTVQGHASRGAYSRRDVVASRRLNRRDVEEGSTTGGIDTLPGTSRSHHVSWRPWSPG